MSDDITARVRALIEADWFTGNEPNLRVILEASRVLPELLAEVQKWQFRCGQAICNEELRETERDVALTEVERLKGALDRVKSSVESGAKGGIVVYEAIFEYVEDVLRGDQ